MLKRVRERDRQWKAVVGAALGSFRHSLLGARNGMKETCARFIPEQVE